MSGAGAVPAHDLDERRPSPGGRLYFVAGIYARRTVPKFVMEGARGPAFLFALPEYQTAFQERLDVAIHELMQAKSSLLRTIENQLTEHVRATHITAPSGEIVSSPPIRNAIPTRVLFNDIVNFNLPAFARGIDEIAEVLTDDQVESLLSYSGRVSEAIGNTGSAKGRPFGWEVILMGLERIEIDFEPDGTPLLPQLVAEGDKRTAIEYPQMSDTERQSFEELMIRKREEFDARRGRSQLR